MSSWEDRMAAKAAARMAVKAQTLPGVQNPELAVIPLDLQGELPSGEPDVPREWCTNCGLPDAPGGGWCELNPPCPRCGSLWRWYGRLADRDGTATGPPATDHCPDCFAWRRFPSGQEHFGWGWWLVCDSNLCRHEHHKDEIWMAAAT